MAVGVWERGSPPGWRRLRASVLARDNGMCRIKGPKCRGRADQVHHTLGAQVSGVLCSPDLLLSSCDPCNGNHKPTGDPKPKIVTVW
jgi:hypothetical protein